MWAAWQAWADWIDRCADRMEISTEEYLGLVVTDREKLEKFKWEYNRVRGDCVPEIEAQQIVPPGG